MPKETFVTITGFKNYYERDPFSIGAAFLCSKEPENAYDSEAIRVWSDGYMVGYIANSVSTKANGTSSAARIYDRVGDCFLIEVCFSTQSKIICRVTDFDVQDCVLIEKYMLGEDEDIQHDIQPSELLN